MNKNRPYRFIISGGGTGGHIFPAIAIAQAIEELKPGSEILFVGAKGKMEMEKIPAAGYKILGLPIRGIQRKITLKNLSVPFNILRSIFMAKRILKDFEPDVAIGVGGYASGPLLYAASKKGIPIVIQEQNSYAGITNKILSRKADKIFVSYEKMEKFFPEDKIILTGNPVRQDIADNLPGKSAAFSHFELAPDKPVIFIMGGSLGSRTINNSVKAALDNLKEENIQVLWQTGKLYFNKMQSVASEIKNIHPFAFIDDMKYAYAAADIIISRAGALSVSELALVGKPVILVPSPNVAEDHQTQNAMALVEKNAAVMISDNKAGKELIKEAIELSGNEKRKEELSQNINKMAHKNAARKIAEEIIQLIDNGN